MNEFVCPDCGKASYTADTTQAKKCPYCIEKCIIVNSNFVELLKSHNPGNLKLIIDRRGTERRASGTLVNEDRRVSERRQNNATPIGWFMTSNGCPSANY